MDHECQDILTLGMIFDVQDKAEEIVAEIKGEISKVEDYLADKDRLTVAVLEDEGGTYRVYGEDVLGGNVAMAGGADLAVGKHGNTGNISAEDLIAAQSRCHLHGLVRRLQRERYRLRRGSGD